MKSYFTNLDFPEMAGDFPAQTLPFGGPDLPNEVYICIMSLEMTLLRGYPYHLWKQQNRATLLSIESCLFHRDPYIIGCYNPETHLG